MPLLSRAAPLALASLAAVASARQVPVNRANWKLAQRYSAESLRPFLYSLTLAPGWINKGDTFWYSWRDTDGIHFWEVDAKAKKKEPLFATDRMAALLSEVSKRPYDRTNLPIRTVSFDEKNPELVRFTVERVRDDYDRKADTLKSLGAATGREDAPPAGADRGQGGPGGPTKFQIKVPANAELAQNLKRNLMLVHGDMDDNAHYAGTVRLMNALMRANKRYDFLLVPGKPHSYGDLTPT